MNYFKKSAISVLFFILCTTSHAYDFPDHQFNAGFYNHHFIHTQLPIFHKPFFWNSRFHADNGFMINELKTIYHSEKYFSVSLGLSLSRWVLEKQSLYAVTGLFELRWWIFRTNYFNPYFVYSIAAPTLLSNNHLGASKLGGYVIFQDYMGIGVMLGKTHPITIELKSVHYSNGDLAVDNNGLQVPFLLSIGLVF